jgi:uncharacterized protein with beta-barrel porin domain
MATTRRRAPFSARGAAAVLCLFVGERASAQATPLQSHAATGNGWASGGALDRLGPTASGDLLDVMRTLSALDDAQLAYALDAVSGEIHGSVTHLAALDGESVMDAVRSQLVLRGLSAEGTPVDDDLEDSSDAWHWGVKRRAWLRVRGERASLELASTTGGQAGLASAHGGEAWLNGILGGFDWVFADRWLAGVGASYANGHLSLDGLVESADYSAPRVLGYVGYAGVGWRVHAGLDAAHLDYRDMARRFAFAALDPAGQPIFAPVDRLAASSPSGDATELWVETRFELKPRIWALQPSVGLRSARFHADAWSETGAGSLSLVGPSQTERSAQGDVGLRAERGFGDTRPFFAGTYRRELSSKRLTTAVMLGAEGAGLYAVEGPDLPADTLVVQAGFTHLEKRLTISLLYELQAANHETLHSLQLGIAF